MNSLFRNTLVKPGAVLALAMAGILSGGAAHAAGTASGTSIDNTASLAYTVGTTVQTPIGSSPTGNTSGTGTSTSFLVDNKVNLLVTTVDTTFVPVVPGLTVATATSLQVSTFKLKNTGNTAQGFLLTPANLASTTALFGGADNIDSNGACTIKVDTAVGNPVAAAGYGTAVAAASIATLAADSEKIVYVVCPFASTVVDGDIAVISLTAQAVTATTLATLTETSGANSNSVVDIVFADIAGSDDAARDATHSARDAFKVKSAKLTVTKTVATVCDQFNGNTNPKNIPGSYVSYTITIANSGTTSATLGIVGDPLTSTLTFDPDLIKGLTAATCDTVASGNGVYTSGLGANVKVVQSNRSISAFKTSSAGDADGVVLTGTTLNVDFGIVLPLITGTYTAGELKPTETVTVTFQAKIN